MESFKLKLPIHLNGEQSQRFSVSRELDLELDFFGNRHISKQVLIQAIIKILEKTEGPVQWAQSLPVQDGNLHVRFRVDLKPEQAWLEEMESTLSRTIRQAPLRISVSFVKQGLLLKHVVTELPKELKTAA